MTACVRTSTDCCAFSWDIQVQKCSENGNSFFVYNLKAADRGAYCAGKTWMLLDFLNIWYLRRSRIWKINRDEFLKRLVLIEFPNPASSQVYTYHPIKWWNCDDPPGMRKSLPFSKSSVVVEKPGKVRLGIWWVVVQYLSKIAWVSQSPSCTVVTHKSTNH